MQTTPGIILALVFKGDFASPYFENENSKEENLITSP
jgi:hypothetical protein